MINNEQHNATDSLTNPSMLSIITVEEQFEHEYESSENELQNEIGKVNTNEFIRVTAAHEMLIKAQTYDEQKNYPLALQFYRICVDFLLEELIFAEGTGQSRIYLREKCASVMDRIDLLKTKLEPIPSSIITEQSTTYLPIDQLKSLNLS